MSEITEHLECYLVGGAVRDARLGRPVHDRDWVVVGARVDQMLDLGFVQVGRDFPVFLHPQTHEEYALARTERKTGSGHTGFTVHADEQVTLEQDLLRRDLTINAMAQTVDGELVDPFNGATDLTDRILRHVSEAFAEDPLRVFRVARFTAQLEGFTVAPQTLQLMQAMCAAGDLATLSAERVWAETAKALGAAQPERYLEVLAMCGGLDHWLPELAGVSLRGADTAMRYASLGFVLDQQQLDTLGQRLKVPGRHQQAAADVLRQAQRVSNWRTVPVSQLHQTFAELRVIHDRARLDSLVDLLDVELDLLNLAERYVAAEFSVPEGVHGADYGAALKQLQIEWLANNREPETPKQT